MKNATEVTVFVLKGFTENTNLQITLFFLFLAIYLFTLLGNIGLILLVIGDSQLHTPMYYFLGVLSSLDACYSSDITPKMLADFMSKNKLISFRGCVAQSIFAVSLGTTECFLLAAMAYDRYVAIYNPLLYTVSMTPRVYVPLILASFTGGILHSVVHAVATFSLSFCGSNEIRHIFCDIPPLLAISCSDTRLNQLLLFYFVGSIEIVTILIVLVSYGLILLAILRMRSAEGKRKVFSTCGSHLTGVSIYHGTILFMYVRPSSSYALQHDMVVSVFYTVVIPMLNPVIYSWRNKDVKKAVKKFFGQSGVMTAQMKAYNFTTVTEFILMGITTRPELQAPLFGLFLLVYVMSLVGNLGMVVLTLVDSGLQMPMYFFLRHLAFTDLGYSTAVGPKMLVNFVVNQNTISFSFCATQLSFFLVFIISELFILSAMSYDRYVAICNPLLYTAIMSWRVCWVLVAIPYVYCTFVSLLVTIKIFTSSFCGYNVISHFYCDSLPLLSLVCSSTHEIEVIILILAAFNLISSLLVVLISYLLILVAILQMKSAEGRRKAFSTCGSHLTVVTVFYGTLIFMYVQPKSSHSFDTDKVASIFYTLVIPMLNPLIYSLRNKDVKYALQRTWKNLCNYLCKSVSGNAWSLDRKRRWQSLRAVEECEIAVDTEEEAKQMSC
ncbi:uncharacterized protein ACOB6Z_010536 [Ctenodactylus gundi]